MISDFLQKHIASNHSNNHSKVAVAVSGGSDSMYLAYALQEWCRQNSASFVAIIVDHGLRPESSKEAMQVQHFLHGRGVEAVILKWMGEKPKSNIQSIARDARYNLICTYCSQNNITTLLTGHTMDDQAETVLLRIIRGSGIDGICGIQEASLHYNINLLRPLLHTQKHKIRTILRTIGWPWVEDPSNIDTHYDRVKVRCIFDSYKRQFKDDKLQTRLCLLAENATRAKGFIQMELDKHFKMYVAEKAYGLQIAAKALALHDEIALRLLKKCLQHFSTTKTITLESLLILLDRLRNNNPHTMLYGCSFMRRADFIEITPSTS